MRNCRRSHDMIVHVLANALCYLFLWVHRHSYLSMHLPTIFHLVRHGKQTHLSLNEQPINFSLLRLPATFQCFLTFPPRKTKAARLAPGVQGPVPGSRLVADHRPGAQQPRGGALRVQAGRPGRRAAPTLISLPKKELRKMETAKEKLKTRREKRKQLRRKT